MQPVKPEPESYDVVGNILFWSVFVTGWIVCVRALSKVVRWRR